LRIELEGVQLKQVGMYKYLRTLVTEDGRDEKEIKARIATAREAFNNLEKVLRDTQLYKPVRLNILNCYVWSMLRYASEAWTISKDSERRLNAFEMWCCQARRYVIFSGGGADFLHLYPFHVSCLLSLCLLKIFYEGQCPPGIFSGGGANAPLSPRFRRHWVKWTDRVTNAEVLRKMGLHELRLLRMIKESKQVYIEKKLKNDSLFALASKGKIIGKAPRGRRRKSMFDT